MLVVSTAAYLAAALRGRNYDYLLGFVLPETCVAPSSENTPNGLDSSYSKL